MARRRTTCVARLKEPSQHRCHTAGFPAHRTFHHILPPGTDVADSLPDDAQDPYGAVAVETTRRRPMYHPCAACVLRPFRNGTEPPTRLQPRTPACPTCLTRRFWSVSIPVDSVTHDRTGRRRMRFPWLHWLGFWSFRRPFWSRRAYFRPTDTSALDAALGPLVDHIVTVRLRTVADGQDAAQRLYRILGHGTSPWFVRPEIDFDFLE